jgi:hypothetical protein
MAVLPAVTEVLLHHIAMDIWNDCGVVSTRTGEMSFLSTVTAVLLHHCAIDMWNDCIVLDWVVGKLWICLQLLQYCYVTLLWIYGLNVVLLVQSSGEMAVLSTVTSLLLHNSVMDT